MQFPISPGREAVSIFLKSHTGKRIAAFELRLHQRLPEFVINLYAATRNLVEPVVISVSERIIPAILRKGNILQLASRRLVSTIEKDLLLVADVENCR